MTAHPYQQFAPSTSGTITPADWCEACSLNPAGTLLALTVNMPKQPRDGQPFALNSTQIITTLTLQVNAATAQTLLAIPTALAIGVGFHWVFNSATNTWMPA